MTRDELAAERAASQARTRKRDHAAFERARARIARQDEAMSMKGRRSYTRRKPGMSGDYIPPRTT